MSNVIKYSLLDDYRSDNQSFYLIATNKLSSPLRYALGGKSINLYNPYDTYEYDSTTQKVAGIFLLIILAPIGIITILSFGLKLISCPCLWEKKTVIEIAEKNSRTAAFFKKKAEIFKDEEAIEIFKQDPTIIERININSLLKKLIFRKIDQNARWDDLKTLLRFFTAKMDPEHLIFFAVHKKLSEEQKTQTFDLDATQILNFVRNSTKDYDSWQVSYCIDKIIRISLDDDAIEYSAQHRAIKKELEKEISPQFKNQDEDPWLSNDLTLLICDKIIRKDDLKEFPELLRLLPTDKAKNLIDAIMGVKIAEELRSRNFVLDADQIFAFIRASLKDKNPATINDCITYLITHIFKEDSFKEAKYPVHYPIKRELAKKFIGLD